MKKVLIYLREKDLAPKGGPYAVGYYIKQQLDQRHIKYVDFLSSPSNPNAAVKKTIPDRIKKITHILSRFLRYRNAFKGNGISHVDLNEYDIVHFHQTREMYEIRKSLESFKGKTILTSHSPVPLAQEIYTEQLTSFEKRFLKKFYSKLDEIDKYAFQKADYIQFPCEEAEEPYIKNWSEYENIKAVRKEHYVYIPTGIPAAIAKRNRYEVRHELGISDDDFYISYVGRHNVVKGYDQLKKIGDRMIKGNKQTWVVVAGKEEPLKRLENDHWIEIGWTNDAHSYIKAADVFVLPNLETYFDIVMLEVLSLGQIVVASRTGGNKYFEKLEGNDGIFLYDSIDEACELLKQISNMDRTKREMLGNKNKELYEREFTDVKFVDRYLAFLDDIG